MVNNKPTHIITNILELLEYVSRCAQSFNYNHNYNNYIVHVQIKRLSFNCVFFLRVSL